MISRITMAMLGKPRVWEVEFFLLSPHEIEHGLSVMEVLRPELYDTKALPHPNVARGKVEKENGLLDLRLGSVERKRRCRTCGLYGGKMGCPGHFGYIKLAMPVFYVMTLPWCKNLLASICYYCSRLLVDQESLKLKSLGTWDNLTAEERWHRVTHYKRPQVCPFQCTKHFAIPQPQYSVEKLRVIVNWDNVMQWIVNQESKIEGLPNVQTYSVCPCDSCALHRNNPNCPDCPGSSDCPDDSVCSCDQCASHAIDVVNRSATIRRTSQGPHCPCDKCASHRGSTDDILGCQCTLCILHKTNVRGLLESTKSLIGKEFIAADAGVILGGMDDQDLEFLGIQVDPKTGSGHPKNMILTVLPVEPRPLRPPSAQDKGRSRSQNDKTHKYQEIVKSNLIIQESLLKASGGTIDRVTLSNIFSLPNVLRQHVNSADIQTYEWHIATLFHNEIKNVKVDRQRSGKPFKSLHSQFKGKPGWWRQHAVAKRVDHCARSVVSPCSDLDVDELGVPIDEVCLVNTKRVNVTQYSIGELTQAVRLGPNVLGGASHVFTIDGDEIDLRHCEHRDRIELRIGMAVDRYLKHHDIVIFGRQPTLHKPSLMAFYVVPMEGNTFRLNLTVTTPFNADFDGDEMNMYVPQSPEEEAECVTLMSVQTQLQSVQSSKPVMALVQDAICATWKMTKRDRFFTRSEACQLLSQCRYFKGITLPRPAIMRPEKLWTGKQVFSCLLPSTMMYERWRPDSNQLGGDMDLLDDHIVVRHGKLVCGRPCKSFVGTSGNGFVHYIWHMPDAGALHVINFLSDAQRLFNYLFLAFENFSIGPADIILTHGIHKEIDEIVSTAIRKDEMIRNEPVIMKGLSDEIVEDGRQQILKRTLPRTAEIATASLSDGNGCKDVISCGSKGSSINIGQMSACVGQQTVEGGRLTKGRLPCFSPDDESPARYGFVRSSLLRGLNPTEFYCHAQAGREGLIDTAVKTSETGYIQRRITRAGENIVIECDNTVRRWDGGTLQNKYGGDGWAPERIVRCHLLYLNHQDSDVEKMLNVTESEYTRYLSSHEIYSSRHEIYSSSVKSDIDDEIQNILELKRHISVRRRIIYHKLATVSIEDVYLPSNIDRDAFLVQGSVPGVPLEIRRAAGTAGAANARGTIKVNKKRKRSEANCPSVQRNSGTSIASSGTSIASSGTLLTSTKIRSIVKQLITDIHNCDGPNNKTRDYYLLTQLTIRNIIIHLRLSEEQLVELCKLTLHRYKTVKVQFGESVGLAAAQSIGEPTTQMTLDTFHTTGIGKTKLVTSGVPRVKELIALHKILKITSMTIAFHPHIQQTPDMIHRLAHIIVETKLDDIVQSVDVLYDPDLLVTRITEQQPLVDLYNIYVEDHQQSTRSTDNPCGAPEQNDDDSCEVNNIQSAESLHPTIQKTSRFVVSLVLDQELLIGRGLGPKDLARVLRQRLNFNSLGIPWIVMASEFNMPDWILRLRIPMAFSQTQQWCTMSNLDINSNDALTFERDLCYQTTLGFMHSVHVGGIKGIVNASTRKDKSQELVIDTEGSNLLNVFVLDGVDITRTTTNNLYEIESVLGIDYASDALFYEYKIPMDMAGASINDRHLSLIADLQCADGRMKALTRHGINQDHAPLTQISFEESVENMLRSAIFKKRDQIMDVTSNVMLGQCIPLGTGRVGIKIHEEYEKLWAISTTQLQSTPSFKRAIEAEASVILCDVQTSTLQTIDDELSQKVNQYMWPSYSYPITDKRRIAHITNTMRRIYMGSSNPRALSATHNPCPLPVSASSEDLRRIGDYIDDYTVRLKSNGERYQLLLSTDPVIGRFACMINRAMSIWDVSICAHTETFDEGSLYDVELTVLRKSSSLKKFEVLDVIQHAGKSFVHDPWHMRYQRIFEIFDMPDFVPREETSTEEFDEYVASLVKQSIHTTKCSMVFARHSYPNLPMVNFVPKPMRLCKEFRALMRQTNNLLETDVDCEGAIFQLLHGTIVTGRDPSIVKWKFRHLITIDVMIGDDANRTPMALLGDGTVTHVPCTSHVRVGLKGSSIPFSWDTNVDVASLAVGMIVECTIDITNNPPTDRCIITPTRVREKTVANTVYVMSMTLENAQEALSLDDVCTLFGLNDMDKQPSTKSNSKLDIDEYNVERVSPSRVPLSPPEQHGGPQNYIVKEFFRPGSPRPLHVDSENKSTVIECQFYRPGSPIVERMHNVQSARLYDKPTDYCHYGSNNLVVTNDCTSGTAPMNDIVLPQEVMQMHTMDNDPLFMVVE